MEAIRTKICGITNLEDALLAAREGADALGFNFSPRSPRLLSVESARRIIAALPPFVTPVGVFVDAEPRRVERTVAQTGIRVLQFHGLEPPDYCARMKLPVIKAFAMSSREMRGELDRYRVDAYLVDTPSEQRGGSGRSFDWTWAVPLAERFPIILAGGLTAENVAEAVRRVHPYAVDVCSGVESSPGKKDRRKLVAFLREVRRVSLSKA